MNLNEHYGLLLGLDDNWSVTNVDLSLDGNKVDIYVDYTPKGGVCPLCGSMGGLHDKLEERTWRHLDTMQFETIIHARTPRVRCAEHGVRVVDLPWAGKNQRFTLMFEAFAIKVIERAKTIKDACAILRLNWHSCMAIMKSAVERGLLRRDIEEVAFVGMDEKSFLAGKSPESFATVLADLDNNRVLDVERGRSEDSASRVIDKALAPWQQALVCGAAIDMSAPFEKAIKEHFPFADTVFDRFHIKKHLNEGVDNVRRVENARMLKNNDKALTHTKYLWLKGLESYSPEEQKKLDNLLKMNYEVGKAWSLKEAFENFWTRRDRSYAERFFEYWYDEVLKSKLKPMIKVANTLKRHLGGLLNWYSCRITNAVTEGFNSKIQAIKCAARGFRNFENYRTSILFFCGRLNMIPDLIR